MQIFTDADGTVASFQDVVQQALKQGQAKSLLILSCDENGFLPEELDPVLRKIPVPVFGGTFPQIFDGVRQLQRGTIIAALDYVAEVHFIAGMSDPKADYEEMLDARVSDGDFKTLMVFVDGLSERIAAFIDALYAVFGLECNYVGGGAGSLSLKRKPCLISNNGLMEDGAVVAALTMKSGVGVAHGWTSIAGPYKVTASERNVIKSLDWEPAFDIYREVVEEHSGTPFISVPFFDIAKAYPFGIAKMGAEVVVRDPLTLDGDRNLVCVGEVPEGEYVDILHGKSQDLIEAAGLAHDRAKHHFPSSARPGLGLFVDCMSRVLFLEDLFGEELQVVADSSIPFIGACTIGEIANSGTDYLEFYNKTSVIALLEGK